MTMGRGSSSSRKSSSSTTTTSSRYRGGARGARCCMVNSSSVSSSGVDSAIRQAMTQRCCTVHCSCTVNCSCTVRCSTIHCRCAVHCSWMLLLLLLVLQSWEVGHKPATWMWSRSHLLRSSHGFDQTAVLLMEVKAALARCLAVDKAGPLRTVLGFVGSAHERSPCFQPPVVSCHCRLHSVALQEAPSRHRPRAAAPRRNVAQHLNDGECATSQVPLLDEGQEERYDILLCPSSRHDGGDNSGELWRNTATNDCFRSHFLHSPAQGCENPQL
mmetsp:Transcript_17792/g.38106  ORF Transcript_17792/g.38106 Transcript_17792/m.38106 type:complete len:272 (+) Transcript_17792:377-1192(+)